MAKKKSGQSDARKWFSSMIYTSLVEGGEIEMRTIKAGKVRRQYINDAEQFETVVANSPDSEVYYGVAIRKEPLKQDSAKSNILGTDLLWAEVDTEKIGWDTDKVLKAIHSLPPTIRPSACVHSGYGLHFYWRLKEPIYDVQQIEQANGVLRDLVSGDNVQDATRILRVPGSTNNKHGKKRECRIVWCYHWQRLDVHELLDEAMDGEVMWAGKWVSKEKRNKYITKRKQDIENNAHHYAWEDRLKKANARGMKVWERTAYHGSDGMYGIDEAVMLFTAYLYCVRSGEAKRAGTKVTESQMQQIVDMTVNMVKKIKNRDAPEEEWSWDAEAVSVRKKLDRWAKRWDGGLREEAERAYKEKRKLIANGITRKVQAANVGSGSKVGKRKRKAA